MTDYSPRPLYGGMVRVACFKWRPYPTAPRQFAAATGETYEEAKLEALRRARARGYFYPSWREWWRWFEKRPDADLLRQLIDEEEETRR